MTPSRLGDKQYILPYTSEDSTEMLGRYSIGRLMSKKEGKGDRHYSWGKVRPARKRNLRKNIQDQKVI